MYLHDKRAEDRLVAGIQGLIVQSAADLLTVRRLPMSGDEVERWLGDDRTWNRLVVVHGVRPSTVRRDEVVRRVLAPYRRAA